MGDIIKKDGDIEEKYIKISDNKSRKLNMIIGRTGISSIDEMKEMIPPMLFRECQKFLARPLSYTKELSAKQRIAKESSGNNKGKPELEEIAVPEKFFKIVGGELKNTRDRKGTGISEVSEPDISAERIIIKMLIKEIDSLYNPEEGTHFYSKNQFNKMKSIIDKIIEEKDFPPFLTEAMKDCCIDAKMLIYYLLLSVQLPGSRDSIKQHPADFPDETEEKYVRDIVSIKLRAMEAYIEEANEMVKHREDLDFINKYTDRDIICFYIRNYIEVNYMRTVINKIAKEKKIPTFLTEAVKECNIDAEKLIRYCCLLSKQLPDSQDSIELNLDKSPDEAKEKYVRDIVSIKLRAMKGYIDEADKVAKHKRNLYLINKYMKEEEDLISTIPKCSARELKKINKADFKRNL